MKVPFHPGQILFEDNHIIIINKKSSQIVQGDKTGDVPLSEEIKAYLKERYHKPGEAYLGVVHRLDRPVSGVVIFAKTSKALGRLNRMIHDREIHKTYWAVVNRLPPEPGGHLSHFLVKDEKNNKSFALDKEKSRSRLAELKYRFLLSGDHYHLLEVELLTGRHHQIRVQLAKIGCIIKGDVKYGSYRPNPDASIHLHAVRIEFSHPVSGEKISIMAPTPKDKLWDYFQAKVS
jgi:23S rRNA pseudouridine1911/1915/1917 synthase